MARKGSLKRKLRSLSERQAQERRDLGVAVLAMYRADELDQAAIEAGAEKLKQTAAEIAEAEEALGPRAGSGRQQGARRGCQRRQRAQTAGASAARVRRPRSRRPRSPPRPCRRRGAGGPGARARDHRRAEERAAAPSPRGSRACDVRARRAGRGRPIRAAPPAAPPAAEADERSAAAMIALEQDLERAQARAGQALEALKDQLEQAQARADRAEERREAPAGREPDRGRRVAAGPGGGDATRGRAPGPRGAGRLHRPDARAPPSRRRRARSRAARPRRRSPR